MRKHRNADRVWRSAWDRQDNHLPSALLKPGATYLRIDAIEQAIRNAGLLGGDVGQTGYAVAQAVAAANLEASRVVVADCVNPVAASREGWRGVASRTAARLIEVEIVCSDIQEHQRRVATRTADIPGRVLPSWETISCLDYHPWNQPHLVVDSAKLSPWEAVAYLIGIVS
jgi:hypothetical protein